jgi:hypothetical protein
MSNGGHDTRTLDTRTLDLDRRTCLSLLASVVVGRVGLSVDALPVIVPVGFRLDGDRIVFALRAQDRARAALDGVVVAFEADDVDPHTGSGWSVLVQGPAHPLAEPSGSTLVDVMPVGGTDPVIASELVSVSTNVITGWRTGEVAGEVVGQGLLGAVQAPA